MIDYNQPDYYLRREQQQRMLAARATSPDTRRFHLELADRYACLVAEITAPAAASLREPVAPFAVGLFAVGPGPRPRA